MKRVGLTILSALLAFLARHFCALGFLMWFALVPLFYAVFDRKYAVRLSGLFGFIYYGLTISWMFSIRDLPEFGLSGPTGFLFAFFCWLGLSIYGAVGYMALFYWLCRRRSRMLSPLVAACGFMLLEGVQGWGDSALAFPWCSFAYSQSGAVVQSAGLFGSVFITFLIVFVNLALSLALQTKRGRVLLPAGVLLVVNLLFGVVMLHNMPPGEQVSVSVVQNNVSSDEKWKNIETLFNLISLKDRAQGDLIVFSETVYPSVLSQETAERLGKENASVMVGALSQTASGEKSVAIHTIENGKITATSYKMHLIPLGEYMPPGFGFLSDRLGLMGFAPGESVLLHGENNRKICSLICFDSCFSSFAREGVQKGASLLAVSTNDSWFDGAAEVSEHLRISVFRAIEQGKYLVHASTTGVTAIADPRGRVIARLPVGEEGILEGTVRYIKTRTLYSYIGELPLIVCLIILIVWKGRDKYAVS